MATPQVTLRIDPEVFKRIQEWCSAHGVSFAAKTRMMWSEVLGEEVTSQTKRTGVTSQGLKAPQTEKAKVVTSQAPTVKQVIPARVPPMPRPKGS